jgi:FMN phosphatase YigB (HAD superfamily)
MRTGCHSANRNFCTENGKNAALLIDIDGTIQVCQRYFDEAYLDFTYYMQLLGFDAREAHDLLVAVDHERKEALGFERDRFGDSIVECYNRLRKIHKRRFGQDQIKRDSSICQQIGRGPFFREPEMFADAAAVLGRAHHSFMMIAVSMGNRDAQKFKLRQAGLSPIFDDLIVTERDDKAELVSQLIEDCHIDARMSAFIGNSQRSDGICLQHTNFVYLPLEIGQEFDINRPLPQGSGFEVFNARDWREAEEKAINRLLRRRRMAGN